MQISIGLPATIPGVQRELLFDWAKKADNGPFTSLGIIGRLAYPNYEPLMSLAAAASITQRIRLMTAALIAPLYNAGVLAKQAATLDALSGGRLTLGLGIGNREDDYKAAPSSFNRRGKQFDQQLAIMKRIWSEQPLGDGVGVVGPPPVQQGGPELLIGGRASVALERAARWGDGYVNSESDPQKAREYYAIVEDLWRSLGKEGRPRFVGIAYYGLGEDARERVDSYIRSYYAYLVPQAEIIARAASSSPAMVRNTIRAFADIGMDELMFWPCIAHLDQVDRLAELVKRG